MRAAATPLRDRLTTIAAWLIGLVIVVIAGSMMNSSAGETLITQGGVVSYNEDRLGRPWRIVRRIGYQTYEIRNGGVLVIAEADDLSDYKGYASEITVDMAGNVWRDKVAEIQRSRKNIQPSAVRVN